jgi:hypothetical protein
MITTGYWNNLKEDQLTKKQIKDIIWIKNSHGYVTSGNDNIGSVKSLLDSTGPGFCLAKFTQGTLHLGTGMSHACHHPTPHKISLEEIKNNPAALFNTSQLKQARREMLEGKRPGECDYCWRVEDSGSPSDRFYKSLEPWALNKHDEIQAIDPDADIYPSYLEVDFSNVCNFSCTYCGPEFSSKWVDHLKQHGPIKLLEGTKNVQWSHGWQDLDTLNYKSKDFNPYIDAFWKWFPEAYKHLKVYRITGGEPLLSKETFKSMDWFIDNPNPDLEFNINSNMGVPEKLWRQFVDKLKVLTSGNYIKKFTLFTSVDGWGDRAEYIRTGLDFELFKKRYEEILQLGKVRVVTMCTFNILSITSIKELLEWQLMLKKKYNLDPSMANWENEFNVNLGGETSQTDRRAHSGNHYSLVGIDIPYLRHPGFLDPHYVDKELLEKYLIPAMNFIAQNTSNPAWGLHQGFEQFEVEKLKRITMEAMHFNAHNKDEHMVAVHRGRFYDFVNKIDERIGTDFLETFPEMTEFYEKCRIAKESIAGELEE